MPEPTTRAARPAKGAAPATADAPASQGGENPVQPQAPLADPPAATPDSEPAAGTSAEETSGTPADAQTFTREQAVDDSFLLIGQPPFVVAAVIADSDAETFTKSELEQLVDTFLTAEVQ